MMISLDNYLESQIQGLIDWKLAALIQHLADATIEVSKQLRSSSITGLTGTIDTVIIQGETQKPLDVISNEILIEACRKAGSVRFAVSEELPEEIEFNAEGKYAVIFDPLDGSSNLDVNVTVGTILSVVEVKDAADILQSGRGQLFAAYAAYGPQTTLVLTFGGSVEIFTLDDQGLYRLTSSDVKIQSDSQA